jgi:hypothetical protein
MLDERSRSVSVGYLCSMYGHETVGRCYEGYGPLMLASSSVGTYREMQKVLVGSGITVSTAVRQS